MIRKSGVFPTRREEKSLFSQGYELVAGVDEVGRGALAGPLIAAAVILPAFLKASWTKSIRDSKLLLQSKRESLEKEIKKAAISVGLGIADIEFINSWGISKANRWAMEKAVENLAVKAQFLLIDAVRLPSVQISQKAIIKGDRKCFIIACASIVAKTYRDRLMKELSVNYPGYYLGKHKGYGTALHLQCLKELGPSPIHRLSFAPVKLSSLPDRSENDKGLGGAQHVEPLP